MICNGGYCTLYNKVVDELPCMEFKPDIENTEEYICEYIICDPTDEVDDKVDDEVDDDNE